MMKKITTLAFAFLLTAVFSSSAIAQISIGGGLTYGTDIEDIGIQVGGTYELNENMRLGADIVYWLIGSDSFFGETISYTFLEVNANFNYIFYNENDLIVYGLGTLGIHYAKVSFDFGDELFSGSGSDTELGLGIGAGLEYNLGGVKLYFEPRFFLSGFDQLQLAAGVRIPI
ncbi:MAG: hypothetical protein EA359_02770 [Balneolaceae bacterium]|nr:MAG: hypothetical protein EA359_02770 [Balneolaceae bacterium]